jgi:hypothetical protein
VTIELRPDLDRRQTILLMSSLMLGVALTALDTTIVGSCGIAVMGAVLNAELASGLAGLELGPSQAPAGRVGALVSQVLDPAARAALGPDVLEQVQLMLAATLREVYLIPVACALAGLALIVLKFPSGSVQQLGASEARSAAR